MKNIHLITGALLSVAMSGCIDDSYDLDNFSDDIYVKLEQVLPVGSSAVSLSDMLAEMDMEGLEQGEDGLIYFQYDTVSKIMVPAFEFGAQGATNSTQIDLSELFPVNVALPDAELDQPIPMVAKFPMEFSDESGGGTIDSAEFKSLRIDFNLASNVPGLLDVLEFQVTLPENLRAESASPLLWDDTRSQGKLIMSNVWADFSESDSLEFKCQLVPTGKFPLSKITSDSYIEVSCGIGDMQYKRLYGLFHASSTLEDTSAVGINFSDQKGVDYSILLADPRFEITAWTNAGVPIDVTIESIKGLTKEGGSVEAKFQGGTSSFQLNMNPAKKEGEEVLAMQATFDRNNGEIDRLVNATPERLAVQTSFLVKGDEPINNKNFYILDSTYINLGIKAIVPLWLQAGSYIVFNDTIDADLYQDIDDYEKEDYALDQATLYLEVENGLPMKTQVDFTMLRSDTIRTQSGWTTLLSPIENDLFKQNVMMEAAELDATTNAASKPSTSLVTVKLDNSMVGDLKKVKHIVATYRVEVPDASASAKIRAQDLIKVKAYMHAKAYYSSGDEK